MVNRQPLACLGHPLRAAFWLALTMASRGNGLKRGQVILYGALGPMQPVTTGDLVQVSIGALGDVSCRMGSESGPIDVNEQGFNFHESLEPL